MSNEQRIRGALFYLSVAVFLTGLPLILSFSLGYKFNPRTFKFTKTGIISIKTQPPGADIYLDGKLLDAKTPATINELLPGSYSLKLELKEHYPWISEINVESRKVTRFEKIILFSNLPNIKQLNQDKVSFFWLDKESRRIYYLNREENILYKSDLNGERFEEIGSLPEEFSALPKELKISPDRQKMVIFNAHQISVLYLNSQGALSYAQAAVTLNFSDRQINNVFWHSDSYHLILVTDRNVEVMEIDDKSAPVSLVNLNRKNSGFFYNPDEDTLYFRDSQKGADGNFYDNVYKLELSNKENILSDLIKLRQNAEK